MRSWITLRTEARAERMVSSSLLRADSARRRDTIRRTAPARRTKPVRHGWLNQTGFVPGRGRDPDRACDWTSSSVLLSSLELSDTQVCEPEIRGLARICQLADSAESRMSCCMVRAQTSNPAHIRQSRPDPGLGFQLKVLKTFELFPCRSAALLRDLPLALGTALSPPSRLTNGVL